MIFFAIGVFLFNIMIAVDLVQFLGVKRISFALIISIAALTCFYSLLFNVLGTVHLLTSVVMINIELVLIGGFMIFRRSQMTQVVADIRKTVAENKTYFLILLPLLLYVLFSATAIPPNNVDSMTYHMARIVHWIQNKDIGYYFTSVDRQNRMGSGAEVLIMLLQMISFADRAANIVQYISFLIFCFALPDLLRLVGINRRNVIAIAVLTVATPMLLLQASTTQNDLVSGVMTWAIVLVLFKVLRHNIKSISNKFFVLAALVFAAAYLVKPTSILILVPLLIYVVVTYPFRFRTPIRFYFTKLALATIVMLALIGPDLYRKYNYIKQDSFHEVYPITSKWNAERFYNVFLSAMHHSPFDPDTNLLLIEGAANEFKTPFVKDNFAANYTFYPHEDYAGNPFHFLIFLALTIISIFLLPFIKFKTRFLLAILPLLSFITVGLFVKDNPWLSRIQLPVFIILPFCFIILDAVRSSIVANIYFAILWSVSFFVFGIGFLTATHTVNKPISLASIFNSSYVYGTRNSLYYISRKDLKPEHDRIIALSLKNHVHSVGVIAGDDFYEYPLSWRLQNARINLEHIDTLHFNFPDLIYLEAKGYWRPESMKYRKLFDGLYLLKKPDSTLIGQTRLDIPMSAMGALNNGIVVNDSSVFFYGDGKIETGQIVLPKGQYEIKLTSNGVPIDGIGSHFNVWADHKKIAEVNSIKPGQIDRIPLIVEQAQLYIIEIEFDNDIYDAVRRLDRNAELISLTITKTN
jgi:hypothetical protein